MFENVPRKKAYVHVIIVFNQGGLRMLWVPWNYFGNIWTLIVCYTYHNGVIFILFIYKISFLSSCRIPIHVAPLACIPRGQSDTFFKWKEC